MARGYHGGPCRPLSRADAAAALNRRGRLGTVAERTSIEDRGYTSPCWIWLGGKSHGYGCIGINGSTFRLHRVSRIALVGDLTPGDEIDHLCRQTLCWNPDHLEPVSRSENMVRLNRACPDLGARTTKHLRDMTHCRRGHPLSGDNLYTDPKNGFRQCRACRGWRKGLYRQGMRVSDHGAQHAGA